jgi:hypothetical protein
MYKGRGRKDKILIVKDPKKGCIHHFSFSVKGKAEHGITEMCIYVYHPDKGRS